MSKIAHVLSNIDYPEEGRKRLRKIFSPAEVFFIDAKDKEAIQKTVKFCDVAFLKGNLTPEYYTDSNLKWIHCNVAGLNDSAKKEVFDRNIILTGAAGRSAPALAEHVFFFLLNHVYAIKEMLAAQKSHEWGFPGIERLESPFGKTMGIVGFGNTGKAVYEKAKAFGMHVIAYNDSPINKEYELEQSWSAKQGDTIEKLLRQSDYIVLALSLNNETYHVVNKAAFSLMKPTAYIINVSRGSIIDEQALIEALQNNMIGGAGLDVTEEEPLTIDSPLWDMENVLITPHTTPKMTNFQSRCLDILEMNVHRYLADLPLLNVADRSDIFTKNDQAL